MTGFASFVTIRDIRDSESPWR